ncbi:ABC transporter permease [Schumannella sp. 10F1B-5-1]|uniref:ABC transporter permease n=1 Tax=Schumannella sp. 10F1B-5-1 TaxID=2590780 RepID=UPI0011300821|nr:ABC transporter permease [Schumannella sp. 10F1B-5-1]TPW73494.1 ABC transporter permease [Schumannella sp. 10F1B-5-1]
MSTTPSSTPSAAPAARSAPTPAELTDAARRSRALGPIFVAEHQLRTMSKFRWTMIATAIGTPLLYLFAFGVGLATLITGNVGPGGANGEVSYLEFVAPALLVTAATLVATEEFTFGVLLGLKWNPTWIGMNASPLTGAQIVTGHFLFIAVRMVITVSIYYVVILLFGAMPSPLGILLIPVGLLAGFAWTFIAAYSATIREDKGQFAVLQRVVILPLTLFSGTVFPLAQLPWFLQPLGWASPLWHASELGRQFAYGPTEPFWLTLVHVVYLLALAAGGWMLCQRIVKRRLDK